MKKAFALLLAFFILLSPMGGVQAEYVRGNKDNNATTDYVLPQEKEEVELLWKADLGIITDPIVTENNLIVQKENTLLFIDSLSGRVVKETKLEEGIGYSLYPACLGENLVFSSQEEGTIEAFDQESLERVWIYQDELGGSSYMPIVYDEGFIFTGFYTNDKDGSYLALDAKTGKKVWSITNKGGFYGTLVYVENDYICLSSFDAEKKKSTIISLDKKTGEEVDRLELEGAQKGAIVHQGDSIYFTLDRSKSTINKLVYKDGKFSNHIEAFLEASASTSPVISGDYLFVGSSTEDLFEGPGVFYVFSSKDLKEISKTEVPQGYPQGAPLLSTAKAKEGIYSIYQSYNQQPGGLVVIQFTSTDNKLEVKDLFIPEGEEKNYCLYSVNVGSAKQLIYRNDSGMTYALVKKGEKVEVSNDKPSQENIESSSAKDEEKIKNKEVQEDSQNTHKDNPVTGDQGILLPVILLFAALLLFFLIQKFNKKK